MRKTVLDLDSGGAKRFFLKSDSYSNLELPPYFSFTHLLNAVAMELNGQVLTNLNFSNANKLGTINHVIYNNKDGKFAWRKLEFIHPCMYVSLVNTITEKGQWPFICNRIKSIQTIKSIRCMSIPVLPDRKKSQKATQINEWLEYIERESIRLALDYEYLIQTDVANCYQSIYTHSISWAIHGKVIAKGSRRNKKLVGNIIDQHIQAMSYGQTNGIPQGSVLMDFIAELVFAYIDENLYAKINDRLKPNPDEYEILRYRDDYRIFVKKPDLGEMIIKLLSETLAEFGMSLNTSKTNVSKNIILDSIKQDKIASLRDNVFETSRSKNILLDYQIVRKELIKIYELGTKFPNSGSIRRRLDKLDLNLNEALIIKHQQELISILANIVFDSPNSIFIALSLISKLMLNLKNKEEILLKLIRKFNLIPNSGYLEIWLQRITLPYKFSYSFKERMCNQINNKKNDLFDNSWLNNKMLVKTVESTPVVNSKKITKLKTTIKRNEVDIFKPIGY